MQLTYILYYLKATLQAIMNCKGLYTPDNHCISNLCEDEYLIFLGK